MRSHGDALAQELGGPGAALGKERAQPCLGLREAPASEGAHTQLGHRAVAQHLVGDVELTGVIYGARPRQQGLRGVEAVVYRVAVRQLQHGACPRRPVPVLANLRAEALSPGLHGNAGVNGRAQPRPGSRSLSQLAQQVLLQRMHHAEDASGDAPSGVYALGTATPDELVRVGQELEVPCNAGRVPQVHALVLDAALFQGLPELSVDAWHDGDEPENSARLWAVAKLRSHAGCRCIIARSSRVRLRSPALSLQHRVDVHAGKLQAIAQRLARALPQFRPQPAVIRGRSVQMCSGKPAEEREHLGEADFSSREGEELLPTWAAFRRLEDSPSASLGELRQMPAHDVPPILRRGRVAEARAVCGLGLHGSGGAFGGDAMAARKVWSRRKHRGRSPL
mmetsp:Transcript_86070/g.240657  ORF Transcript_86070/g.240657 Transcript_86070/m.240657 type:complete len:394 (-) Transcript_86070:2-1183(-)